MLLKILRMKKAKTADPTAARAAILMTPNPYTKVRGTTAIRPNRLTLKYDISKNLSAIKYKGAAIVML